VSVWCGSRHEHTEGWHATGLEHRQMEDRLVVRYDLRVMGATPFAFVIA
jgi:hypothetical protein